MQNLESEKTWYLEKIQIPSGESVEVLRGGERQAKKEGRDKA